MNVVERLLEYDGKRVEPFREVAEYLGVCREGFETLLELAAAEEVPLQVGATWGLKHMVEAGLKMDRGQGRAVVGLLGKVTAPEALLHLLQLLPELEPDPQVEEELRQLLLSLIRCEHKFVRAWAYGGLGQLVLWSSDHRPLVESLYAEAMEKESASVRARVRNVWKEMERDRKQGAD